MVSGEPTTEPNVEDFPANAVYVRGENGELKRIMSADGKKLLWPTVNKGQSLSPMVVEQMVDLRSEGNTIPQLAEQVGIGETTVKRYRGRANATLRNTPQGTRIKPDFSHVENQQLPFSVTNAIRLALGTATRIAVIEETPTIKAFFEGYIAGFDAALAIICGAGGIDLSFLEVEHDDKSSSNTDGT